jgi:transcriptional regulator with XRE-family HTH domain
MDNSLPDLSAFTSKLTPDQVLHQVVMAEKRRRKTLGLTQAALAKKAAVSLGSLKRFEQQGEIAFSSLCRIGFALDALDDFLKLFARPAYRTIEDVLHDSSR